MRLLAPSDLLLELSPTQLRRQRPRFDVLMIRRRTLQRGVDQLSFSSHVDDDARLTGSEASCLEVRAEVDGNILKIPISSESLNFAALLCTIYRTLFLDRLWQQLR